MIDLYRIPRKILESSPRRRNPAHGCLWYRSVARSARISCCRSGHRPKAAGVASPTTGDLDRVPPMPDVLLPRPGEPASVHARLAHPRAPGPPVAASATLCVPRVPPSTLGNEQDLRYTSAMDRTPLSPGPSRVPWRVSGPRVGPALWPL